MRGMCENLQWTEIVSPHIYRSDSFKTSYVIVPSGVPLLAATVTMKGYQGWQTKYEGTSDYMCATKSVIRISIMKFVFLHCRACWWDAYRCTEGITQCKWAIINCLFGMFHSNIPPHNKKVILQSMQKEDGIVCVVFATMALGMGVNFVTLNTVYHYGAQDEYWWFFLKRVGMFVEVGHR